MTYRRNTRAQSMFVVDQEIKRSIKLKLNEKTKQIRIGLLLEFFYIFIFTSLTVLLQFYNDLDFAWILNQNNRNQSKQKKNDVTKSGKLSLDC
jgi:hypothetical protein